MSNYDLNEHIIQHERKFKVNVLLELNTHGMIVLESTQRMPKNTLRATRYQVSEKEEMLFSDTFENNYSVFCEDEIFTFHQIQLVQ